MWGDYERENRFDEQLETIGYAILHDSTIIELKKQIKELTDRVKKLEDSKND